MSSSKQSGLGTRAIHAGQHPDPSTGAIMTPIYATSTYVQKSPGVHQGYEYSRTQNPTRIAYEKCIADLEGGRQGFAFASGMATTATILDLLDSGSHVIAMDDLYGGSYRLFERVRRRSAGLDFTFVDLADLAAVKAALKPNTRMIWAETPTNPMLKLVDLARLGAFAKKHGLILVVDNTFCSPILQRPLEYGARYRRALGDEIPQWPFGHGRRCRGRRREQGSRRADGVPAELGRRGCRAVRLVPRHARAEDPASADARALRRTRSTWRSGSRSNRRSSG